MAKRKRWGLIDQLGDYVVEPCWMNARPFSLGLAAVVVKGKRWGFIDRHGQITIEPRFEDVLGFSEDMCAVKENGKWGFIDREGEYKIEPCYHGVSSFLDGSAFANENGETLFLSSTKCHVAGGRAKLIDRRGISRTEFLYTGCENFSEGLCTVWRLKEAEQCVIDSTGRVVFEIAKGTNIGAFSGGLAKLSIKNGLCGFVNERGVTVIEPQFCDVGGFADGLAAVNVGGKHIEEWVGGPTQPQGGKWGYLDSLGKMRVEPVWDSAKAFAEDRAAVVRGTKAGYINSAGVVEIEPQYKMVGSFSGGLAMAMKGVRVGYVDTRGRTRIEHRFNVGERFHQGVALVKETITN